MPRRGIFTEKILDAVAKIASSLLDPDKFDSPVLAGHIIIAVRNIGIYLRDEKDAIYCKICGKGPFTRKGYYLHLTRVHSDEILQLVEEEAERISRTTK